MLLIRYQGGKAYETLIHLGGAKVDRICTLSKSTETVSGSVLTRVPPGEYEEAEGDYKIRADFDSVIYSRLEDGGILYYWTGKRFRPLTVSE